MNKYKIQIEYTDNNFEEVFVIGKKELANTLNDLNGYDDITTVTVHKELKGDYVEIKYKFQNDSN